MAALTRRAIGVAVFSPFILIPVVVGILAQDLPSDPVPVWPDDGRIPTQYSDRYVFLTADRHTIVVLVPERPETGMAGPKSIVRIPLWNNILPSVSVSLAQVSSVETRYRYEIHNANEAQDPIGRFSLVVPASISDAKIYHAPTNGRAPWGGPNVRTINAPGRTPAVAPHVVLKKPPGQYVRWFYQGDNLVPPGGTLGGFEVQSSYLPGLTTGWFSAGRLVELDQAWPREILQQLELLEHPRWREAFVVTVGPMFPPDTPKVGVIGTFRQDVEEMIKAGWLDLSSTFVQEVMTVLAGLSQDPTGRQVLKSSAQSKTEKAVAAALEGSLGIVTRSQ